MRYLCVGYYDREKMDALPKATIDAVMSECPPFMEELSLIRQLKVHFTPPPGPFLGHRGVGFLGRLSTAAQLY